MIRRATAKTRGVSGAEMPAAPVRNDLEGPAAGRSGKFSPVLGPDGAVAPPWTAPRDQPGRLWGPPVPNTGGAAP